MEERIQLELQECPAEEVSAPPERAESGLVFTNHPFSRLFGNLGHRADSRLLYLPEWND